VKFDGSAAEPVKDTACKLIVTEQAAIVKPDIPGKTVALKSVRQPADRLCLLKE